MRKAIGSILLAVSGAVAALGQTSLNGEISLAGLAGLPLFFEAPATSSGPFIARGHNYEFAVWPTSAQFVLSRPDALPDGGRPGRVNLTGTGDQIQRLRDAAGRRNVRVATLELVGANSLAHMEGVDTLGGKVNYLIGDDPTQWRAGISTYAKVRVQDVYPDIDLVYYGNQQELEYDFVIAPDANPDQIKLRFDGVESILVNPAGELVLRLGGQEIRQHRPNIYQTVSGSTKTVSGGYKVLGANTVGFDLGAYDRSLPLVIDPIFSYSTYFGGAGGDAGYVVKVDARGNVYLAGGTRSTVYGFNIPSNAFQRTYKGGTSNGDGFIAKLTNNCSQLVYFTYLGGTNDEAVTDLALDSAGNAYVTGFTDSGDFPTKNAFFPRISGPANPFYHDDVFVAELNATGSALVYSTFLGGNADDIGTGIAVDGGSNAYVTGYTFSTNFPLAHAYQNFLAGLDDVFVAKFGPGGTTLAFCTYLGGSGSDEGQGIAVDSTGHAYVTGYTHSFGFPTFANATQTNFTTGIFYDAFVTKLSAYGSNLIYSTFIGGSNDSYAYRITLDSGRNAYVAGASLAPDFPHAPSVTGLKIGNYGTNGVNFDAFVTKFTSTGVRAYSVLFGGTNADIAEDIGVDPAGRVFVTGFTTSSNFPVVAPFGLLRATSSGLRDVFVTALDASGTSATYSAYLGGTDNDYGYGIAVDAESSAYIAGVTYSTNFPVSGSPFQSFARGPSSAFLAKLRLSWPMLTANLSGGSLVLSWPSTSPDFAPEVTTNLSGPRVWSAVSQTPLITNGSFVVTVPVGASPAFFRLSKR